MYRNILIATDGSDLARHACEHGVALAHSVGARATFVTVTEPFSVLALSEIQLSDTREEYEKHVRSHAERTLANAVSMAAGAGVEARQVHRIDPRPEDAILDAARVEDCDAIVMASHGRKGVSAVLIGSVTMKVLAQTDRPVIVVR